MDVGGSRDGAREAQTAAREPDGTEPPSRGGTGRARDLGRAARRLTRSPLFPVVAFGGLLTPCAGRKGRSGPARLCVLHRHCVRRSQSRLAVGARPGGLSRHLPAFRWRAKVLVESCEPVGGMDRSKRFNRSKES